VARTKAFDPDEVLQRALELFWRRGYEATSMADLVGHLGIARASIYATFGDKHSLYLKALKRYLEFTDERILAALTGPGAALPQVRALVWRYAEDAIAAPLGCMVANAAVELAATDPAAALAVEASWSFLEASLTSALARGRADNPRATARFLLVLLQGIQVLSRAPGNAERIRDAALVASASLK
jgi:TetR/AcrR family transcriptional repressor of nem operon